MIPVPLGLKYLPFQEDAILFSKDKPSVLFADEMGLGKTVEAIGFLNEHTEIESLLVVCPATLKINWARELDAWLISPCVDVEIINYDILHKLNMNKSYDVLILDEIHYAKSRSAKRSRLCRLIKAKYKLGLTGTPLLNRPEELFHPLHLLDPITWPMSSYKKFTLRYCNAHMGNWGWDVSGASHLDELQEKLAPLMIRRLKKDVLKDMPEKRWQIIELPTAGASPELRAQLKESRERVAQIEGTYAHDIKKLESALSVEWQEMAILRHEVGRFKVLMALELVGDILCSEKKVIIFAHHRDVVEELQIGLAKYFPAVIHGGTTQAMRQSAVDRFQRDVKCRVFVGNIQAAGVGITLTAASHVVFCEADWTPGIMEQAADRCHRIGQKESVLIQHLVLEGSLDAHIAKTLMKKRSVIDKVLGG